MPLAATITGTRSTAHRPLEDYRTRFETYLLPFTSTQMRIYLGGATGIDSLALLWLATETQASLTVVCPATLADQPADARHAITTVRGRGRLDDLVELRGQLRTAGFHARNRWMVDRSEFVIGFPLADGHSGGTHYTLDYASSQSKPHLIVPV